LTIVRLPALLVAIRTSRQSCSKAEKRSPTTNPVDPKRARQIKVPV
jgi:hypothetical protein